MSDELSLLKLENVSLRSQLATFEERLNSLVATNGTRERLASPDNQQQQQEQKHQKQQHQRQQRQQQPPSPSPLARPNNNSAISQDSEITALRKLLTQVNLAKKEVLEHMPNHKPGQMGGVGGSDDGSGGASLRDGDVECLHSLLTQQTNDAQTYQTKVADLKKQVHALQEANDKVQHKRESDKVIFIEMLRRERRERERKVAGAELKVLWFGQVSDEWVVVGGDLQQQTGSFFFNLPPFTWLRLLTPFVVPNPFLTKTGIGPSKRLGPLETN